LRLTFDRRRGGNKWKKKLYCFLENVTLRRTYGRRNSPEKLYQRMMPKGTTRPAGFLTANGGQLKQAEGDCLRGEEHQELKILGDYIKKGHCDEQYRVAQVRRRKLKGTFISEGLNRGNGRGT